jgi:hypothetical protein
MSDPVFRTAGPHGPGQGFDLSAGQVDGNFWALLQRVVELETGGIAPRHISNITQTGTLLYITLSDATVLGPFSIPVAKLAWRGNWTPSTPYALHDVVRVGGVGVYAVLADHTSAAGAFPGGANYQLMLVDRSTAWDAVLPLSDAVTPITAGTGKEQFFMPRAVTLTAVRASLKVAQTSGALIKVDINRNGVTMLSTKLTIDNNERNSVSATVQPVLGLTALAANDELTFDIDEVGNGTAIGLKVTLLGETAG